MKTTTFKKIIPALLIVMILSIGIFGAFGVETVSAQGPRILVKKQENFITKWLDEKATKAAINTSVIVATGITMVTGAVLGISGVLLNISVDLSVKNFGDHIDNSVIKDGWKMFRDLANIIIIFALLVIGIATILRIEGYGIKKLLGMLIIVALLINFSMFFTQIIIDSSNLLASQFYDMAKDVGTGGISNSYLQAFKFGTIYDIKTGNILTLKDLNLDWDQILIVGALASVLFLITAFALFAASVLFIVRYIALIFLIILSPLAFVGMILPKTQNLASKWWSALFSYAFFAPIFLLLTWFSIKFINSDAFQAGIGLKDGMKFSAITQGGVEAVSNIPLFLNFAIAIGFILGSLILASKMGGWGSSAVMSWGKSARKWGQGMVGGATVGMGGRIMRNTLGRGASKWADSEDLKKRAASKGSRGVLARMQLRGLRGVAGSSFDARATKAGGAIAKSASLGKAGGKGGYEEKLKGQVKNRVDFAKSIGTESYKEKTRKRELVMDIEGADGKGGKQKTLGDLLIIEKTAKIERDNALPEAKKLAQDKYEKAIKDKEIAQAALNAARKSEKDFKPGVDRQQQYADTLETEKTIDTAFRKVSRKGKVGAIAVRQAIKDAPNKKVLDEIAKQIKASDSSVGETKEKPESESSKTT